MPLYCSAIVYISVTLGDDGLTPDDMDTLLSEIRADLSEMKVDTKYITKKVDSFCTFKDSAAIDIANLKSHCENQKSLPDRVSSLEKFRWLSTGALIILAALIGWGWLVVGGAK